MSKVDIIWSPNQDDKFVTFGSELSLYKVEYGPPKQQALKLSDETFATLLSTNTDNQFIKCISWYPRPEPDHLLAVGLANGRVVLSSFGRGGTQDPNALIGREFVPKHARQCNHLAWNPQESNLLAEALDKYRADYSVLIWDVYAKGHSDINPIPERRISVTHQEPVIRPIFELGPSETTLSLSWFPHEQRTLVTGMNHKFLRIFDLRDTSRPKNVAYSKAVYGVCVDPFFEHRLASFFEGSVSVWDRRNFEKPMLTLSDMKQVIKVAWSPTRSGLLGVLHKESPIVKLYDIQNTPVGSDELEPAVIERIIQPTSKQNVSSFDWHHTHENRMISVTPTGTVRDVRVFERIALTWSPDIYMMWACGRQLIQCHSIKLSREANEDISIKMKRRAQRGYGLQEQLWENAHLVGDDPQIRKLWHWLSDVRSIQRNGDENWSPQAAKQVPVRYVGVKTLLLGDTTSTGMCSRSEVEYLQWQNTDGVKLRGGKKSFRSDERFLMNFEQGSKQRLAHPPITALKLTWSWEKRVYSSRVQRSQALQLCGWGLYRDAFTLNDAITKLESEGEFERAAAIAVFNLQVRRAIEALQQGATTRNVEGGDLNLNVVAMALSGFTDEKFTLWHQMCAAQGERLDNPYLAAIFAFLTSDPENYEAMLKDSAIEVIDKVALACIYLSDVKLSEYVKKLANQLVRDGNLDGILLTGLSGEGMDLLEGYVDRTGDIQTASLIALQGFACMEVEQDPRGHTWIENYRQLLDTWKLWHQRAEFDVFKTSCDSSARQTPQVYRADVTTRGNQQVYVSCTYCGKSIASNMPANRNRHLMYGSTTSHRPKITSCPGCRKPLPRCALCLINMGTAAGSGKLKPIRSPPSSSRQVALQKHQGQGGGSHNKTNSEIGGEDSSKLSLVSNWFTWCQTCRHGGHASHIAEWFQEHAECPVTGCQCKCTSLDPMASVSTDIERISPVSPVH